MKKILLGLWILGCGENVLAASAAEYVQSVEQINADYQKESRQFLKGLNPQQQGFSASQNQQFCAIVQRYVDRLSRSSVSKFRQAGCHTAGKIFKRNAVAETL